MKLDPYPCPKCDEYPKMYDEIASGTVSIRCRSCGLTSGQHRDDEEAISNWNIKPKEIE